ncbi:hypothetical protein PSEUDO8BK_80471 [Pseudomonas sp. 8BK]|nr:hypothetical protein PSEUDO8BK_80471 [Pseudomonas sp. 8BK]
MPLISVPSTGAEEIFARGRDTRKVAIKWVSLKSSGTPQMRNLVKEIFLSVVCGLAGNLLFQWIEVDRSPAAPSFHHYSIVMPDQPLVAVLRSNRERPVAAERAWSF